MCVTLGVLPSYLCNSMCCAMLLQSNKERTSKHINICMPQKQQQLQQQQHLCLTVMLHPSMIGLIGSMTGLIQSN